MPEVLWKATVTPDVVTVPARTVLSLDGQGAPEGDVFQSCIMAMYGAAYTLKFTRKKAGRSDFKIGPLEARWWTDPPERTLPEVPRDTWRWQLRIAIPGNVSERELAGILEDIAKKKGGKLDGNPHVARVARTVLPPARYGRVLHVGPYATEGESFCRITDVLAAGNLVPAKTHLEVYLSDPRRTKPEKLKTVLLLELAA